MNFLKYLGLYILTLAVDLITKSWALSKIGDLDTWFSILGISLGYRYTLNTGVAFSLFAGSGFLCSLFIYGFVTLALLIFSYYTFCRYKSKQPIFSETLVLAGGSGNLISRLQHQGVIDFISIDLWGITGSVINIADIFIMLGIVLIGIRVFYDMAKQD